MWKKQCCDADHVVCGRTLKLSFKLSLNATMDSEEVALDWGGNEDDEVTSHQYQHQIQNTKQPPKDEATLSLVAESLLALRQTSGPEGLDEHDQEDRYSDAVSLGGGGEDDMEQLHAYQSRTHLGGTSPVGRKSTHHSQKDSSERANQGEYRRYRSPSARSPPRSTYSDSPNAATGTNEHSSKFSPRDQRSHPEIHREEPTDSSSFPRLPSGPLALPPKPTGRMKAPFVHPSNPAMMSASSMAPAPRERDRDSGERRPHSLSTDEETPLEPNWEVRTARDGSGDQYYYNTKTHESTWNRSVATGSSMNHPPTSGSVKDQNQEPARESSHLGLNGNQQQGRPSHADDTVSPSLTIRDRHYSPPAARNSSTLRPVGAVGADIRTRQRSPSPRITSYHVSHVSHRG
ncbi:MAG TPA: hypothetical protein VGO47_03150, partial [Chlamydiales bacterium]|nr:hypothetical protein [Chlamydiales bacterium]